MLKKFVAMIFTISILLIINSCNSEENTTSSDVAVVEENAQQDQGISEETQINDEFTDAAVEDESALAEVAETVEITEDEEAFATETETFTQEIKLSLGAGSSCILLEDSTVQCWGNNYSGQLGNNTNDDSYFPVNVVTSSLDSNELSGIIQVDAGNSHVCALSNDTGVKCWGSNEFGQLGNNELEVDSNTPVAVFNDESALSYLENVEKISAGESFTCALLNDTSVKCWGDNGAGQLGNNSTESTLTPVFVVTSESDSKPLTGAIDIQVGAYSVCALMDDTSVKCWGNNRRGQLGNGSTENSLVPLDVISSATDLNPLTAVEKISINSNHVCALMEDTSIKCWGYNNYGQLGDNSTNNSSFPVDVIENVDDVATVMSNVVEISTGEAFTCSLMSDSTVKCWGNNEYGQLGDGLGEDSTLPLDVIDESTELGVLTGVNNIAAGLSHVCALLEDNSVKCWGNNDSGQLGNAYPLVSSETPIAVVADNETKELLLEVIGISLGNSHSCALLNDTSLKCWGYNSNGQVGNNTTDDVYIAESVIQDAEANILTGVEKVGLGNGFSCALMNDSTVKCWGSNSNGVLGNNSSDTSKIPVSVVTSSTDSSPLSGVQDLAIGNYYSCVLMSDSTVKCWGYNKYGQLGNNDTSTSLVPVDVITSSTDSTPLQNVVKIATNYEHTCVLLSDTTAKCWGRNSYGKLGNNSTTSSLVPVSVVTSSSDSTPLSEIADLGVGRSHSCALMDDTSVKCWGWKNYGQLGNGKFSSSGGSYYVPSGVKFTSTTNLTGAVKLAVGSYHNCILMEDNTQMCWGHNTSGQLGNNDSEDSAYPVYVQTNESDSTPVGGIIDIAVGSYHTCSILEDTSVKCWGGAILSSGGVLKSSIPLNVVSPSK
ncbi:MAG: hypothetical protein ABIA04_02495 [Pseudomonadota bacterium]